MKYSIIILTSLLAFSAQVGRTQENFPTNRKELTLGIGFSKMSLYDNRYSAQTFSSTQPSYHFSYKWQREDTRQEIAVDFAMDMKFDRSKILDLTFIKPTMRYSLQKRSNDLWIGGVVSTATLLNFPRSRTGHFNNSPISYTFANSMGPKVSYNLSPDDSRFSIEADLEAALLGYVVRPAYGHPYPTKFLESGTFTPTRAGMTSSLIRGGKLMTIGKFNSINLVLGFSYMIGDHVKLGVHVNVNHLSVYDVNQLSSTSTDVLFTTSYIY